jgi:eukaryotic-like serine/threonine-protein kinase
MEVRIRTRPHTRQLAKTSRSRPDRLRPSRGRAAPCNVPIVGAPIKDADLLELTSVVLESKRLPGVSYRLERVIGEGAQGVVFLATQRTTLGELPVVIKVLRPRAVRDIAGLAAVAISKEVAALERLSAQAAPSPHVVRFLDTGTLRIRDNALELPWLAVEYIEGGPEGTTLRERVADSLKRTGCAFDMARAHRAITSMISGVSAMHSVGVVHRDVNPGNVLCSGTGETESFKIADFGLARVSSVTTFGSVLLGTPGYCAPEQSFPDKIGVGPHTDVFSLACCAYFVLSGEPYFEAPTIPEMLVAVYAAERRKLRDAKGLCAELKGNEKLCGEIDGVLERGTAADPRGRVGSADLGEVIATVLM